MDSMMFPASGYGPLPPSAMAEIEKRMAVAMRNSNFQKMLELEKKHKIERLHSAPASPPPPAPPVEHQEISLQVRRADSLSQQQNYLMLKAVRRSVVLPSLSIDIPPSIDALEQSKGSKLGTGTENGNHDGNGSSTAAVPVEPLQKQVKFLAPDDDDEMSDQSSICQSPSWEGYGQRKKEKKKEAERRRKEKEQAEKEARAAKRRPAARLSKSPPPGIPGRAYRSSGLTSAERSMSDPLLVSQHLHPETQRPDRPDPIERTISADDLQNFGHYQPAVAEVLSDAVHETRQFVGGVKLDREREAVLQRHLSGHGQQSPAFPHHLISESGTEAQSSSQSFRPDGPIPSTHQPQHAPSTRQESRTAREMFPPSASRTPMLRQISAPTQHNRNQGFLQGATKIFRGKDGKDQGGGDHERGRKGGYVQYQSEQNMERSIAEMAYEQLVNSGSIQSSSTRSSSRNTQHRRSSFTQEARSVAMKLAGIKPTPSTKEESRTSMQSDYFNYLENTSSSPGRGVSTPSDTRSIATRNQDVDRTRQVEGHVSLSAAALRDVPSLNDRPPTAHSAVSSNNPSIAGSNSSTQSSKKNRSLRDAAKAAFTVSRGPHPQQSANPTRQTMLAPPYQTFRGRMESQALAPEEKAPPPKSPVLPPMSVPQHSPGEQAKMPLNPLVKTSISSVSNPPEANSQAGSRASEGSSSSSAYEDGSPLPSPVTTPDTSRPQSSKDLPYIVGEITKGTSDKPLVQDDDATLRQPSDDSSTSTTPRLVKSDSQENLEMADEDRWSRTALPIDIDTDAQSFTTSFSNLDHLDNIDETLAKADTSQQPTTDTQDKPSPAGTSAPIVPEVLPTKEQLARASADQNDITMPVVPPIMPPPRSKRRGMSNAGQSSSPQSIPSPQRENWSPGNDKGNDETTERPAYPDSVLLRGVKAEDACNRREEAVAEHLVETEPAWDPEKQIARREKGRRKLRHESSVPQRSPAAPNREVASTGAADIKTKNDNTAALSNGSMPPELSSNSSLASGGPPASFMSSPYVTDCHESTESRYPSSNSSSPGSRSPPSPASPQFPRIASPAYQPAPKSPGSSRSATSAQPSRPSSAVSNPHSAPSVSRLAGTAPVSILKQPARSTSDPVQSAAGSAARAPILSALPKHMLQQAGMSVRPPVSAPEARMAPIAKMFVECCNCKFYHDMPSKLYECMAKPDAVVEDRLLGISGAITTMVKCPWCQHNMSTSCCAGYAAVVYLKEKLH